MGDFFLNFGYNIKNDSEVRMKKAKWHKPELVVLFKGRPEESVLTECKANAAPDGTGGIQTLIGHGCQAAKTGSCQACQSLGGNLS